MPSQPMLKVAALGLGPIGRDAARRVVAAAHLELVAAADSAPQLRGRKLAEVVPGAAADLSIQPGLAKLLRSEPDVVLVCTGSRLAALAPELRAILATGASCLSTAEELCCPLLTHPQLGHELDALAREHGARLLGTGVNPGFVLDALPVFMASAVSHLEQVTARRIVDSIQRRPGLRRKTGCGLEPAVFATQVRSGSIGHLGLLGSAHLLAAGVGFDGAKIVETIEPVTEDTDVETPEGVVPAGHVTGVRQLARASIDGRVVIELELVIAAGQRAPGDSVSISSQPPLELEIRGGLAGDGASAARLVSAIAPLLRMEPGLRTVLDLPLTGTPMQPSEAQ